MHAVNASHPVSRLVTLAPASSPSAIGNEDRFDVTFGGPSPEPDYNGPCDAIDRFPAWLAGGIIVGLSGVFWIGLLTILGWII